MITLLMEWLLPQKNATEPALYDLCAIKKDTADGRVGLACVAEVDHELEICVFVHISVVHVGGQLVEVVRGVDEIRVGFRSRAAAEGGLRLCCRRYREEHGKEKRFPSGAFGYCFA